MRAVATMLSIALLGCFPHNPKARTYAKITEGSLVAAGIGLEFLANSRTGADCEQSGSLGMSTSGCKTTGSVLGGVGLGMILTGLTGFIATISTAEEEKEPPAPLDTAKTAPPKGELKLPPGVQPAQPAPAPAAPGEAPTGSAAPTGTASP
ncbi:MAG: hypothetical protein ACM31C_21135 [Acidobacteriota bacterium]